MTTSVLGKPRSIGSVSILEDRSVLVDISVSLRTFKSPPIGANLLENTEAFRLQLRTSPYKNHPNRLDRILKFCQESEVGREEMKDVNIVTWRGILKKLLRGDKIELNVSKHGGTLYLEEYDRAPNVIHRLTGDGDVRGPKFEALCSEDPNYLPFNARWYSVMIVHLGHLKILYAGEVDCVEVNQHTETDERREFVELKSRPFGKSLNGMQDWFTQSYLTKVPKIIVGFHKDNHLHSLQTFVVPETLLPSPHHGAALGFLVQLIGHEDFTEEGNVVRVKFHKDVSKRSQIVLSAREKKAIDGGEARVGILPAWFLAQALSHDE
ncbi:hypothetical protein DL96DRAFT_1718141 [Flagelloscypha sp. PMI_526]|nr:hypothetical protein DL96DRAFT_1718141 [Flagelloscypha sp. PMI_526]